MIWKQLKYALIFQIRVQKACAQVIISYILRLQDFEMKTSNIEEKLISDILIWYERTVKKTLLLHEVNMHLWLETWRIYTLACIPQINVISADHRIVYWWHLKALCMPALQTHKGYTSGEQRWRHMKKK